MSRSNLATTETAFQSNTTKNNVTNNVTPTVGNNEDLPQLQGSHVTNVPQFDVKDFTSWKDRFLVYLDGLEPYLLQILKNGPYVPKSPASTLENVLVQPQKQWSPKDRKDEESLSSEDEGTTTVKDFMAIAKDEPTMGKTDAYKVSLDQLLTKQVPSNIVHALGGKGKKDSTSSIDVVFTKAEDSPIENSPECPFDDESVNDNQEPLPALPKLSRAEPIGTSKGITSATDLTQTSTVSKKTKHIAKKESQNKLIKKKAQPKTLIIPEPSPKKKADSSSEELLFTIMKQVKGLKEQIKPSSDNSSSISQIGSSKPGKNKQKTKLDSGCTRHMTRVKQCLHRYSKESVPKVAFGDNSSGNTKGYGLVNYNGITFTRVAYVNGLKQNLINISQLCDANFKVLFTKTQGTIFNQNNKVMLIAPRRRYVYVINMPSYNEESNACFFAKASNSMPRVLTNHLGKFDEQTYDGFFLGYSPVAKAFRVFNIRRQELEETFHVSFNEADEVIRYDDSMSYVPTFDPLSTNTITVPDLITPLTKIINPSSESLHSPVTNDHPVTSEPDESEPAEPHVNDNLLDQVNSTTKVITNNEAEPIPILIPPPAKSNYVTPTPQDKWSRDKHILLVTILDIEPKRVIDALQEEGWVIAIREEMN
ncbi:hypothetical protein Tco_0295267 [Tanacetum coccineum]